MAKMSVVREVVDVKNLFVCVRHMCSYTNLVDVVLNLKHSYCLHEIASTDFVGVELTRPGCIDVIVDSGYHSRHVSANGEVDHIPDEKDDHAKVNEVKGNLEFYAGKFRPVGRSQADCTRMLRELDPQPSIEGSLNRGGSPCVSAGSTGELFSVDEYIEITRSLCRTQ